MAETRQPAAKNDPGNGSSSQCVESLPVEILCIDDDLKVSDAIGRCLSDFNVNITSGFFGTHGFCLAKDLLPDLIITDYRMPQGDGEFVIGMVRQNCNTADIPIIVLTGVWDEAIKTRMLNDGADEVLHKPIQHEALIEAIARYVDIAAD